MSEFFKRIFGTTSGSAEITLFSIWHILWIVNKVIQTFVYHGLMFAWGFLSVSLKAVSFNFREIWKEAVGIVILIAWAFLGNYAYGGIPEGHHYDWFFITGSTFPFIPPWLMPFVVFAAVYGMCVLIYLIDYVVKRIAQKKGEKNGILRTA